jgi:hypothetical protein
VVSGEIVIDKETLNEVVRDIMDNREKLIQKLASNMGYWYVISSFSESFSNIQMFTHYADAGRGFVLGYSLWDLLSNGLILPVNYSNKLIPTNEIHIDLNLATRKEEGWSYEKEWRMIDRLEDERDVIDYEGIDYEGIPFKSIIFGYKMNLETQQRFAEILKNESIEIYNSYPKHNELSLEFNRR